LQLVIAILYEGDNLIHSSHIYVGLTRIDITVEVFKVLFLSFLCNIIGICQPGNMSLEETSCSTRKIELSRQCVLILCHLSMFGQQIAPRQGPMRVREFTLAEIEHFVNPYDKSHPKFKDVAHLEFFLFPRAEQTGLKDHVKTCIGDAVAKVWASLKTFL
jgi:hypothetical protein